MRIILDPDVATFEAEAGALLLADEPVNGILLAGIGARRGGPLPSAETYLARIVEGGATVLAAMRFPPPRGLALGTGSALAAALLAETLALTDAGLPSVSGPLECADTFAAAFARITGRAARRAMATDVMVLRAVVRPPPRPGAARMARADDAPILAEWLAAFAAEATPHEPVTPERARTGVDQGIAEGRFFVWEAGGDILGMAARSRSTRTGLAINAVFTPPGRRGQGVASSLVAAMCEAALLEGKAFCCLYVDRANPISNRVYRRLGFEPVAVTSLWLFDGSGRAPIISGPS